MWVLNIFLNKYSVTIWYMLNAKIVYLLCLPELMGVCLLQEKIMRVPYGVNKEYFKYSLFLVFCNHITTYDVSTCFLLVCSYYSIIGCLITFNFSGWIFHCKFGNIYTKYVTCLVKRVGNKHILWMWLCELCLDLLLFGQFILL